MEKELIVSKIVDYFIGRAVEKLQPTPEKSGLYVLPEFHLFGQSINLGEIAFKPKEGNALIINTGDQLDGFLCMHKGYCFLHELFPISSGYTKTWDHEKNKWWCVQIPSSKERVDKIITFLKKLTGTPVYNSLPFLSSDDEEFLKSNAGTYNFQETIGQILEDDVLEEIYGKTGYLIFQNLTFQKTPGFRKINFSQFDERSTGSILHRQELSPYYRVSFFPYAFIIPEAEDANNIPTKITLTIKAQCVNPYIAHVMSGDPFVQFSSTVINSVTEVVRENFVHEISRKISLEQGNEATKQRASEENIIKKIQEKVAKELTNPEAFFGFDFGFSDDISEIVQIIDIDIVGPMAEKLKAQAAENFHLQNVRENNLAKAVVDKEIAEHQAAAKFMELNAETLAIRQAVATIYGEVTPENIEQYYKYFIEPRQKKEQLAAYQPGGINVSSSEILKNILNK